MQRDLDLIRQLLLTIEGERAHKAGLVPIVQGYDDETVEYHLHLAHEAGLLCHFEAKTRDNYLEPDIFTRLSWAGHEWLDLVRDLRHWHAAKMALAEATGGRSFKLLEAALEQVAAARLRAGLDAGDLATPAADRRAARPARSAA